MGWKSPCAALFMGLTITPVATGGDLEGRSGPLAWRATDVQQNVASVDGKRHARHEFALTVKNTGAQALTLESYGAAITYFGLPLSEMTGTLQTTVPPGSESRLSFATLLACLDDAAACRFAEGPSWRIVVAGRAAGDAFTAPIEVTLPVDGASPIVRRESVRVTRPTSSPDPTRVAATFKANIILVPVSINGQDLTMVFDTGAQASVLSSDAARRLGIAVPADAPVLPLMGVGPAVRGPLVLLPPLRVGDYVVEHLTGVVTSLEFPFVVDGFLGANFIEAFRVSIDYRAKELRLEAR